MLKEFTNMKKLLALLLLSPLVFADSREKVINLVCNPTTTLICINDGDCQTFTEQDMRLNKIGDTEIKNISVKQLKTENPKDVNKHWKSFLPVLLKAGTYQFNYNNIMFETNSYDVLSVFKYLLGVIHLFN
mgnify:CR=1 FL=1